jgi:hypothetical protein
VDDPIDLLALSCAEYVSGAVASIVGAPIICGVLCWGHQYMWDTVGLLCGETGAGREVKCGCSHTYIM